MSQDNHELSESQIKEDAKRQALEKVKQKVVVVNIDSIAEAEVHKAADSRMSESKKSLKGFGGFFKKIWKHSFLDEYYRQKEANKIRDEIKDTGSIYAGRVVDGNKVAHEGAMEAISKRFASEYEGTLSEGEEKEMIDSTNPETTRTRIEIKNLINEYAKGNIEKEVFVNEKTRILDGLGNQEILKGSGNYADNLFEIATNARIAIEHGAKMEELDYDLGIIIGKAKSSLKTEAHFNNVDKVVDRMKHTKIGRFMSPAVLSTSIGLAYSLSIGLGKKVLRSKAAAYGTLGAAVAVSSIFAGMNESQRLAAERAQHGLDMAENGKIAAGSKRREQMQQFQYQMENSNDLFQRLHDLMFEKDKDGNEIAKDIKQEDLDIIFATLGDIEARNSLNSKNKIDLISYSKIANVEQERTDLSILTARTKVELREKFKNGLLNGLPQGETFDTYLKKQTQVIENSLLGGEKGVNSLDKDFSKFKTKQVAKKILSTALIGLTIGATVQEGVAFFKDHIENLTEGMFGFGGGHVTTQTPLEHFRAWIMGHSSHMEMGKAVEAHLNENNFRLPEGTSILQNDDGTYNILNGDHVVSDHVPLVFDANGHLDSESISRLGADGIVSSTADHMVTSTQEIHGTADEYVNNNPGSTHAVVRDGWYDENTPKPIFEKNELELRWGGAHGGTGIDTKGNYVMDVSHMTSDGSYHKEFSVDAQEKIKNGGLKIIFSLTQGTQHHVFEAPIDTNGNAVIDPNSEIGKLFFGTENGHAVFKGRFAEVVQSFGTKDGAEHVKSLATLVGPGHDSFDQVITTHVNSPITTLDLPLDVEPPYFIPVGSRAPLEKLEEEKQMAYYFGASGAEISEEKKERYRRELTKTLKENPNANLDEFKEIESYLKKQDKKYIKYVGEMAKELGPMNKDCRLSVCIPAAGHQEGEVIYQTLQNYTKQTIGNDKFEIVVFVNRPEKDKEGKIVNPDSTLEEIQRFQKDYPDMNIRVSDRVLPVEDARIAYARKLMSDAVLIRQHERGENAPELFMVSNDADNKGVAPEYIENFISKFDGNKETDSMIGQLDWDPASYIRNPLIHIGTRLMLYNGGQSRVKGWYYNSSGANFAYRSSIYAGVGGYTGDQRGGGEDTDFGAKITASRENSSNRNPIAYAGIRSSRLYTSSRRAEMAAEKGLASIEQWDLGFSAFDDGVRKIDWESKGQKVDYSNKEEVEKLVSNIEIVINRTINRSKEWGSSTADKNVVRSLGWLGVKYDVTGPYSVKITDASKLIEGLEQYQKEGLNILKEKTNFIKARKEKINKSKEEVKNEKELETYMGKFSSNEQKVEAVSNMVNKSLSDVVFKKLGIVTSISKINKQLKSIKNTNSKEEFNQKVKDIIVPVISALQSDPKEYMAFQRKAFISLHDFIPVNEVFSYGIYNGDLHLHLAPASDLNMSEKFKLLNDALSKIAKIAAANPDVKEISATSWIVASNPGIFKKLGFTIEGSIDKETKDRDFPGDERKISRAYFPREKFIKKYNK